MPLSHCTSWFSLAQEVTPPSLLARSAETTVWVCRDTERHCVNRARLNGDLAPGYVPSIGCPLQVRWLRPRQATVLSHSIDKWLGVGQSCKPEDGKQMILFGKYQNLRRRGVGLGKGVVVLVGVGWGDSFPRTGKQRFRNLDWLGWHGPNQLVLPPRQASVPIVIESLNEAKTSSIQNIIPGNCKHFSLMHFLTLLDCWGFGCF